MNRNNFDWKTFIRLRAGAASDLQPAQGDLRQAAVALILRRNIDDVELLIIKRALSQRDHWSGHLALPGGRRQSEDPDLCFTALRETCEEVGIDLASGGEVLGHLETIRPQSPLAPQIAVTPFVAIAPSDYHILIAGAEPKALALNHEIADAFWVPVPLLKGREQSEVFRMIVDGQEYEWPAYTTLLGPIWGMTERIITDFLSLVE